MKFSLADLRSAKVHFIGVGGAGMSGIARIMLDQGISVTGSDVKESQVLVGLRALGGDISVGHAPENIDGAGLIVVSGAISEKNVEMLAARASGVPILQRAEALSILMSDSISVAVAGTHGKTTTTSMLTVAVQHAGLDPSFAIGGMINSSGTNAHRGSGSIFIAEADESDGSFLVYHPFGAIVTNVELDHVDHFADLPAIMRIFQEFVSTIRPGGFLVLCSDDPGSQELRALVVRQDIRIVTYGESGDFGISRISLAATSSSARITLNGRVLGELKLSVPGKHNIYNAVAALAAGTELGVDEDDLLSGLSMFTGTRRRFEVKGEVRGVRVVDDYGHHPTEIDATLTTARLFAGAGRLLVIFQPHRFSRTQAFASEFAATLSQADSVYLLEIYPASEDPIPGVTSALIAQRISHKNVIVEPSMVDMVNRVVADAREGDVIMTLGAGDVSSLAPVILSALSE
ncbi:MAG: UDP-N-acetylmuramate--L-alanine ligase [Actinomycetes bacterium]